MTLRLLLVDDHAVVRTGLRTLIESQPDIVVVGEAGTGSEAIALADECQPDVVIIDIALPDLNGMQIAATIVSRYPQIKVLALSAYEDSGYLHELLRVGAVGYVLKRSAAETLIQAIRTVVTGGLYLDAALAAYLPSPAAEEPLSAVGQDGLSDREYEVIQLIAQGYTNKEVAAQLDVSVKTVETYKTRAMDKLSLRSRVELVRYAAQVGWFMLS